MSTPAMKYWAFISYSHQDEAWASWLHRALETYRVPRRLVGRATGSGSVPRRLFPVFRDRDELPSSHELGAVLTRALAESRNLVVICSPRSAASKWVNEEIKAFRALGRSHRVFCLIVDGEPHASANPEHAFAECFAPALRGDAAFEPIAADARPRKDGKDGAKLKLLAGLLGVGLDELKQREKQRRFWQAVQRTVAAVLVVGLLAGTWQWFSAQRAAREQEILIERLVENGRLELLDGRQARAAVYLNEALKRGHDTVPVRFMLGQAMQAVEALTDVRVRHGGSAVRKAVFSPDGTRFVLIVEKEENIAVAKIYDAATGAEIAELAKAPPAPRAVRFLRDGALLVTGFSDTDENGPVSCTWKSGSPQQPQCLPGFNGRMGEPVSPDGRRLLIAGGEGRIGSLPPVPGPLAPGSGLEIRDLGSGAVRSVIGKGRDVSAAAFSRDGRWLAVAYGDGIVEIRDSSSLSKAKVLPEAAGLTIVAVAFTPDGGTLIALSRHGDVRVWDSVGKSRLAFAVDPDWVTDFAFDGAGRRMLTIGSEGYKVWSMARGSLLFTQAKPLSRGASGALSADGDTAYLVDVFSNAVDVWSVLGKRKLYSLDHHTDSVTTLALDPGSERVVLASRDGQAEVWRTAIKPLWKRQSFEELPYVARFDHDGDRVIVGRGHPSHGDAISLDAVSGELIEQFSGHSALVFDGSFNAAGDTVVTASWDGTARIWDPRDGSLRHILDHTALQVTGAMFSPDGSRIVTTTRDFAAKRTTVAKLWSAEGQLLASLDHFVPQDIYGLPSSIRFDRSGQRIATSASDGGIQLWNSDTGGLLKVLHGHASTVVSTEFSRDGKRLLSAGLDNAVRVWSTESGAILQAFDDAALGQPSRAIWAPDERSAAITTRNGNVWVWDIGTDERRTFRGHAQWTVAPLYLHQGGVLLSYSLDGTVQAWNPADGTNLGIVAQELGPLTLADPDAEGERLVTSTWGQVSLWNVAPETRTSADIAAVLLCQSPWKLDPAGAMLVQTTWPSRCTAQNPAS